MKAQTTHPPDARDLRFERNVAQLHRQGARPVAELLRELGATSFRMTEIEALVEKYARVDPDALRSLGGDCFPSRPLHIVRREP